MLYCLFCVALALVKCACVPIVNVNGYSRNEMVAVHLATAYCLPALLYSCESWSLRHELKPMTVAWNNTFRKIFNCCWRENPIGHVTFAAGLICWQNIVVNIDV